MLQYKLGSAVITSSKWSNSHCQLRVLIMSQWFALWIVRSCEVSKQPIYSYVLELPQSVDEFTDLVEADSQPPHASVDLDMNVCDNAGFARSLVQSLDHIQTINHRRELLLNTGACLDLPKTAERQNRLHYA